MRKILGYIKGNFHDFLEIMVDVLNEFLFRHPLSSFLSSRWDLNPDSLGEYATSLYHSPPRRPSLILSYVGIIILHKSVV